MDFDYNEKKHKVNITAYNDIDICTKCPKVIRNHCPLLNCIVNNYVYPAAESLEISSCSLYNLLNDEMIDTEIHNECERCIWFSIQDDKAVCGRLMPDSWLDCKGKCEHYEEDEEPS